MLWEQELGKEGVRMTYLSLPSPTSEASAEKTQSLGLTRQLGTKVIWELVHLHIWHLGEEYLTTGTASWSMFMWPPCGAWLPYSMEASSESDFSPASLVLQWWLSPWTGWHCTLLYSQAPGVTQLHFQHTLLGTSESQITQVQKQEKQTLLIPRKDTNEFEDML